MPRLSSWRGYLFAGVACSFVMAFYYELDYIAPLTKSYVVDFSFKKSNFSRDLTLTKLSPPRLPLSTTIGAEVLQKVESIYKDINVSKNESVFPAEQVGNYTLLNPHICSDAPRIHVIIIVHTAPGNLKQRNRIRQSFANRTLFYPYQVRIAFLLGQPKDKNVQEALQMEHNLYKDTVQGEFKDDYHNLTLKGVMGFRWISQYCSNSDFILKIDDDVIIDMYKVLSTYLDDMKNKPKSIFCNVWRKNMMIMRQGKWKVPDNVFHNRAMFPYYYCSGFSIFLTSDLAAPLYKAAHFTPFFWIDDLFLYGMLPKVVGGVTWHNYAIDGNQSFSEPKFLKCLEEKGLKCQFYSCLTYSENRFPILWRKIQSVHKKETWKTLSFYEP